MQQLSINGQVPSLNSSFRSEVIAAAEDLRYPRIQELCAPVKGPYQEQWLQVVAEFNSKIDQLASELGCGNTRRRDKIGSLIQACKRGLPVGTQFLAVVIELQDSRQVWSQETPPQPRAVVPNY